MTLLEEAIARARRNWQGEHPGIIRADALLFARHGGSIATRNALSRKDTIVTQKERTLKHLCLNHPGENVPATVGIGTPTTWVCMACF